jgi:hypothetical protein
MRVMMGEEEAVKVKHHALTVGRRAGGTPS